MNKISHYNYIKHAIFLPVIIALLCGPIRAVDKERGDIIVHLRLYEGSRGNEAQKSSVVSSYFLKPLFVSSLVSELDIREEQKELKRIFNLSSIKLMTRTQWGWKYGESEKRFRMVVLNGHEFLVRLTMKGKKNGFKVEVLDNSKQKPEPLLETDLELPQKKSTVFGFEDSLRKPFFICLQREENRSIIDMEPLEVSADKPKLLKRVQPQYPQEALQKNIQGEVILDATTDNKGNIAELLVVEGVPELNKAAEAAVRQWKYEPYIKDGKARPVRFTVIIHFNLPGAKSSLQSVPGGDAGVYFGEPMDFHFDNADLFDVLRIIAKIQDINIVVDPGLTGYKVTCRMKQVPWDQALDWMLQLNGLDMIFKGNVLRILKAGPKNKYLKKSLAGKMYSGKPFGMNFKNADIRDVMKIIARITGMTIDVEPEVKGRVTCQLQNIPWDQALDLILQLNGLDMRKKDKVITVFKPDKKIKYTGEIKIEKKNIPGTLPVRGYLKDAFGWRKDAMSGEKKFHNGIDIAAKKGTEVIAPADGTVTEVTTKQYYGKLIIIDHGNGYTSRFGELDSFKVKKGDKVKQGQVIGTVGNSGTNGPFHLHYEIHFNNKPVNPLTVKKRSNE
jgi:TonB family protein